MVKSSSYHIYVVVRLVSQTMFPMSKLNLYSLTLSLNGFIELKLEPKWIPCNVRRYLWYFGFFLRPFVLGGKKNLIVLRWRFNSTIPFFSVMQIWCLNFKVKDLVCVFEGTCGCVEPKTVTVANLWSLTVVYEFCQMHKLTSGLRVLATTLLQAAHD